jgi:hypothetical protein
VRCFAHCVVCLARGQALELTRRRSDAPTAAADASGDDVDDSSDDEEWDAIIDRFRPVPGVGDHGDGNCESPFAALFEQAAAVPEPAAPSTVELKRDPYEVETLRVYLEVRRTRFGTSVTVAAPLQPSCCRLSCLLLPSHGRAWLRA